jgi:hypothetical protein
LQQGLKLQPDKNKNQNVGQQVLSDRHEPG